MLVLCCIALYLVIGILINLVGTDMREVNKELREYLNPDISEIIKNEDLDPRWMRIMVILSFRIIVVIFWSIILIYIPFDKAIQARKERERNAYLEEREKYLYFDMIGGAGKIICKECNYNQELIGFIHDGFYDEWSESAYQCQQCGKFHEIKNTRGSEVVLECTCGGELSREHRVVCPNCKSYEVKYYMRYIT